MKQLTDEQRQLIMENLGLADEMVDQLKDVPLGEKEDLKSSAIVALCEAALEFDQYKVFEDIAKAKIQDALVKELEKLELK